MHYTQMRPEFSAFWVNNADAYNVLVCIPKCCSISYFLPLKSEVFLVKKNMFFALVNSICLLLESEYWWNDADFRHHSAKVHAAIWLLSQKKNLFTLGSPIGGPFFFDGFVSGVATTYRYPMWQSIKVEDLHQWFGLYKDKRYRKKKKHCF